MTNDSFKNRVIKKLEREGYRVHPIRNDNNRCPFDLISFNPNGKAAGVKLKAHGHLTKEEKEELWWYDTPIYVASEKYEGGSSKIHGIKVKKLEECIL
jgi:hypothetical protein